MPYLLDDLDVDPETKRVLGVALEKTRVSLGLADDFANGIIAKRLIKLAKAGEHNPDLLCQGAIEQLRGYLTLRAPPPLLPFPFPPSRLLAPAELCARRLGPLPCHCNPLSVERPDPPLSNRRAGTGHHALWLAGVVTN